MALLSSGRLGRKERTEIKLFLGWACSWGLAGLVGPAVTTYLPLVPGEEHSSGQGQQGCAQPLTVCHSKELLAETICSARRAEQQGA